MSVVQNPPQWRLVEQAVAALEAALAGEAIDIRSPDRVIDHTTGQMREVDIAVRRKIGSATILITFECRDHSTPQDSTWIEQVITKQRAIRAQKTVVVSTSGFSEPAIRKAVDAGIEVRTLKELSADDIRSWCLMQYAESTVREHTLRSVFVAFDDAAGPDPITLSGNAQREWETRGPSARILATDDGELVSPAQIVSGVVSKNPGLYDDIEPNKPEAIRNLHVMMEMPLWGETTRGRFRVDHIRAAVGLRICRTRAAVTARRQYVSPDGEVAQQVEVDMPASGGIVRLILTREAESGITQVGMKVIPNHHGPRD